MIIKSIHKFVIPENLKAILTEQEYWEDDSFTPLMITIEKIQYRGEHMISYQADFGVLDEYENIGGYEWEELIRKYIQKEEPKLLKFVKGDSESSTCVIWTNDASKFKQILGRMIELIENKNKVFEIKQI